MLRKLFAVTAMLAAVPFASYANVCEPIAFDALGDSTAPTPVQRPSSATDITSLGAYMTSEETAVIQIGVSDLHAPEDPTLGAYRFLVTVLYGDEGHALISGDLLPNGTFRSHVGSPSATASLKDDVVQFEFPAFIDYPTVTGSQVWLSVRTFSVVGLPGSTRGSSLAIELDADYADPGNESFALLPC